jgi:hypothetical protein
MPENPYEPPQEGSQPRPRKAAMSVLLSASFAVAGVIIGATLLAPYLPFFPGDPGGRSIGAGIGGTIGLLAGVLVLCFSVVQSSRAGDS